MQTISGNKLLRKKSQLRRSLPQGNTHCSWKSPTLVGNTNIDSKAAESCSLSKQPTNTYFPRKYTFRTQEFCAVLSVIYLFKIGHSWMTLALVPHRKLPAIIIDHPLEGDNHICLGMDVCSLDTVVPRHIPKSRVNFLKPISLSVWHFTSGISRMKKRGRTMDCFSTLRSWIVPPFQT